MYWKKLRKKCNKKKNVNMNTATLRTHDGYNGIGEATVDEFHFLHEIVKPFHIETPISVNQLRDTAIFYYFFLHSSLHSKKKKITSKKSSTTKSYKPFFLFFLFVSSLKKKKKKYQGFKKLTWDLGFGFFCLYCSRAFSF